MGRIISFYFVFSLESIDLKRIAVQICVYAYVVMMHTILLHLIPADFWKTLIWLAMQC